MLVPSLNLPRQTFNLGETLAHRTAVRRELDIGFPSTLIRNRCLLGVIITVLLLFLRSLDVFTKSVLC